MGIYLVGQCLKRPRYTRGFLTRVSRFFGQSSLSSQFWWRRGQPSNVFFFLASRVLPKRAVSVALAAVKRGWVCWTLAHWYSGTEPDAGLSSLPTHLDYMSSFLTEINIFALINIGYINQIYYFQPSIYLYKLNKSFKARAEITI